MKRSYLVLGSVAVVALGPAYLVTLPTETAEASITLKPNEPAVCLVSHDDTLSIRHGCFFWCRRYLRNYDTAITPPMPAA